jgi:RND superfamily putative drug exporter
MGRIGRLAFRHRVLILVLAVLFVAGAAVGGRSAEAHLTNGGFTDPGTQSSRAGAVLGQQFHAEDPSFVVLGTATRGTVRSPAARAAGQALSAWVARMPGVASVQSFWAVSTPDVSLVSRDSRQAVILGYATGDAEAQAATAQRAARDLRGTAALKVQVGGAAVVAQEASDQVSHDLVKAESIAVLLTLVLLVFAFRSLVAAALPMVIGGIAIVGTLLVLRFLGAVTSVSEYALNLATALGLGLGIDYSLLLVSRFREELTAGQDTPAAVAATVRTAGRTVAFSALTVAVALLALLLFPEYFLSSFGYAGIAVVALAATAALLVVPALLAVLGPRVNRLAIPLPRLVRPSEEGRWHQIAALVMRYPARIAVAVAVVLAVFILPFSHVRLGLADDRVLPAAAPGHQVGNALRDSFPAVVTAPVDVVAPGARPERRAVIATYARALSELPGAAEVQALTGTYASGRRIARPASSARQFAAARGTWFKVLPAADPASPRAQDLVRAIRAARAPFAVMVGGLTAQQVDTVGSVLRHLPPALALMALVTFLALFLMTGSVVIPAKALVLSAASLSATFGVAVWVFQEGHLAAVLHVTAPGYLDASTLMLMFCVAFGLSMDYQVFLLSRIAEEHARGRDTTAAVAMGLERTGGIVTTAAGLLAIVFIALGTSSVGLLKLLGAGISVALILDATLIRALLLPAMMRLLGSFNWWAPRRLRPAARFPKAAPVPVPPAAAPGAAGPGPRPAATAASSACRTAAPRSQPAPDTAAAAAAARAADAGGPASTARSAAAQAAASPGGTSTAADPATSASAGMSLATTGTPAAIASSTGRPYPSTSDGQANADAARYTAGSNVSSTSGSSTTREARPRAEISPGSGSLNAGSG